MYNEDDCQKFEVSHGIEAVISRTVINNVYGSLLLPPVANILHVLIAHTAKYTFDHLLYIYIYFFFLIKHVNCRLHSNSKFQILNSLALFFVHI